MPRLALLLFVALAACRGAGSDPKCDEARRLYIQHQRTAVDQALPSIPRDKRADFTARADAEIDKIGRQFAAACADMDAGKLLARPMGTGDGVPTP